MVEEGERQPVRHPRDGVGASEDVKSRPVEDRLGFVVNLLAYLENLAVAVSDLDQVIDQGYLPASEDAIVDENPDFGRQT